MSGQKVTAQQLGWLQPKKYVGEATSTLNSVNSTWADIPGCFVNVTTETANARYDVTGIFDCAVSGVSTTVLMDGRLVIDGVADTAAFAIHAMDNQDRDTVSQIWDGTLATPGVHTLKLQGALSGAASPGGTFQIFSKIKVEITENV
ncbi:hypothetical protein [Streptomyces sp. NPDC000880]